MENIGDRVRRIREEQGIERKVLAQRTGMSYSGLSDLESGKAKTTTKLHRLAAELGVDVRYLETGEGDQGGRIKVSETKSQTERFEPRILAATHRALRELYDEELGLVYNIEEEPEQFLLAYELHSALDRKAPGADPIGIFRAAGLAKNRGAARDGRDDGDGAAGLPDEGTHKGKMAGKVQRKKG